MASNRQSGEPTCTHYNVPNPSTLTPLMVDFKKGSSAYKRTATGKMRKTASRTAHYKTVWRVAPSIRECCRKTNLKAQIAWWWEVDQRFKDLATDGIEGDPALTRSILESRDLIEQLLATVVPKPPESLIRRYGLERGELPRRKKLKVPGFVKDLGIEWPCTLDELNAAWRKLALQHHPDRGGSQAEFVRVKLAYEKAKGRIEGTA